MSRFFSLSTRAFLRWAGFDKSRLPDPWTKAVEKFTEPGGSAETKLGKLKEVYIKSRDGNPIHQSHLNPADKNWVISAEISGENGKKVCHVYEDGTGTTKKGDDRR